MANPARRLADNVDGEFYVDDSCIDCGACRWIAPATFGERSDISVVVHQPTTAAGRRQAIKALIACPTASIGTTGKLDLAAEGTLFPDEIAPGVYHCGYHARSSYGAASWLIVRPQGNVLIDSPRFATQLVKRIEAFGGVATMFLTHCDDVADHEKFHDHFGCTRILHKDDVSSATREVERQIEGREPIRLDDDILLIPVPGHTRGSTCLLYRDEFLFAGDHFSWLERENAIRVARHVCWYDWDQQVESTARLAQHRFEWILRGHGAPGHRPAGEMARAIRDWVATEWLRPELTPN
jgi:glyoxylase-like metal-dependent hydrolase (beta-lactamase superfamily II)/ferredoxin